MAETGAASVQGLARRAPKCAPNGYNSGMPTVSRALHGGYTGMYRVPYRVPYTMVHIPHGCIPYGCTFSHNLAKSSQMPAKTSTQIPEIPEIPEITRNTRNNQKCQTCQKWPPISTQYG